jgi:hypothetical protein
MERGIKVGYFRDEHWIIEGDDKALEILRDEIINEINKAFVNEDGAVDYSNYISPVLYGLANRYSCLFVPADGSKEGWETSSLMDEVREKILRKVIHNNAKNKSDRIGILKVVVDEYKDEPSVSWLTKEYGS